MLDMICSNLDQSSFLSLRKNGELIYCCKREKRFTLIAAVYILFKNVMHWKHSWNTLPFYKGVGRFEFSKFPGKGGFRFF